MFFFSIIIYHFCSRMTFYNLQKSLKKKKLKNEFFQFFFIQIIHFLIKIEFYVKKAFFRGIACWNSSKITNFGNFAHIQPFFDEFSIFTNFFGDFWKKIPKRGQMSWNLCQLLGKHDFWAKICSRAKIAGGAPGAPPKPDKPP